MIAPLILRARAEPKPIGDLAGGAERGVGRPCHATLARGSV
jgi:hypothetical protein